MTATVLASVALALAVAACAGVVLVARQSADAVTTLRRHRIAHSRAEGTPDPERRDHDHGPPEGRPERRRPPRYAPDPEPEPATGELEAPDLPTTSIPAADRPRPKVQP